MKKLVTLLFSCLLLLPALALAANPRVVLETSAGAMTVELYPEQAPKTVANFLSYVEDGSYDGTIFHRVIPGFVVQGGGYADDWSLRDSRAPVVNESANGLSNSRGTIAMARTQQPDSATRQFYFNLTDNNFLDGSSAKPGYTVFGRVIEGEQVLEQLSSVPTHRDPNKGFPDVPVTPLYLKHIELVK